MIDEDFIYALRVYFPITIKNESDMNYINSHFDLLEKCVKENLFQDAFLYLHILYMSFVYFQLFRIKENKNKDFNLGCIGFSSQKKDLEDASSPFTFAAIKEKSIFRFFRLVGFDDSNIGSIAKCVETRNKFAHAYGIISFSNEDEFTETLDEYLINFNNIVKKQSSFLIGLFDEFNKTKSSDFEYSNIEDEIRENFIARNFISVKELSIILSNKSAGKHYKTLKRMYPDIYELSESLASNT